MERDGDGRNGGDAHTEKKEEKNRTVWRVVRRRPESDEPDGEFCFDLIVEDGEEVCRLRDAARSEELATALLKVFREGGVTPLEAPYILEDLMASPEWID